MFVRGYVILDVFFPSPGVIRGGATTQSSGQK